MQHHQSAYCQPSTARAAYSEAGVVHNAQVQHTYPANTASHQQQVMAMLSEQGDKKTSPMSITCCVCMAFDNKPSLQGIGKQT